MTYTLIAGSKDVIRDVDGATLPPDPGNVDYQDYQAWLAAGNRPNPAPAAPVSPREVRMKQVRYALNILGVRATWNTTVAKAAQSNPEAQDYWDTADPVREDNAKVVKWCAAVGITPKQLFDIAVTQ